jgi:peptidoglycan/LPS O-acetylase OafA/YrhL
MESLLLYLLSTPLLSAMLNVLAYIDPGTGSIILQALVASVVGAAIAVKLFWHRILKFIGIRKGIDSDPADDRSDIKK